MKVRIRRAKRNELKVIQDLNHELFLSDKDRDKFLNFNWPYDEGKRYFLKRITDPACICLVADVRGKIIGYLAGSVREVESWRPVKRTELENMLVKPEFRSGGIGSKLVEGFLKWSKAKKVNRALVVAYATNIKAVEFYRRNGFVDESIMLEIKINNGK